MKPKIIFLTLRVFSATGGIEKVCRVAGKAMYELGIQYGGGIRVFCMYGSKDIADDNKYFPQLVFRGFNANKIGFVAKSVIQGSKSRVVMMSHIHLLVVGWLIRLIHPSVKLVLLAHGIEVWKKPSAWKRFMMRKCDLILPVSRFTRDKMMSLYSLPEQKFNVINNCLDPFLEQPLNSEKNNLLLKRYGLTKEHTVLLTVSRMSDTEKYKGYDKVLQALPGLVKIFPLIRYLLAGKYDMKEKGRIDKMIRGSGLEDVVIFTGFVGDEELAEHFRLADIFVMPSEKEGFGIVFIEALFYGIPVIAGNLDGSVDALCDGELGSLVNPESIAAITMAVETILKNRRGHLPDHQVLMERFSYRDYKRKLGEVLFN